MKDLNLYEIIHCPDCGGSGYRYARILCPGTRFRGEQFRAQCQTCKGSGMVICKRKRSLVKDNRLLELS